MVDEKVLRKIFTEFYSILLDDDHAGEFFNSFALIDSLISRQSSVVKEVFKALKDNNEEKAREVLIRLAKRHRELGIDGKIFYDSVKIYEDLVLKNIQLKVDNGKLWLFSELLKKTTAEVYISDILEEFVGYLTSAVKKETDFYYDQYIYHLMKRKIETFRDTVRKAFKGEIVPVISHTTCEVGKFLDGLAFDIIAFSNNELALKIKFSHKKIHSLERNIISEVSKGCYERAVSLTQSLVEEG
ncbi:MAG: hypothetical protein DSZ31_05725 [Gammaproteobacteria bacterium]|nr:MAG: hypothetical protein DSZ31_05725 [Gammaproteobacteria bacterium]